MTKFMVSWEDHPSHLTTRLGQLLEHQTLVDVTLMCNTHTLRVHRAVLAAGSPYFESILMRQLGQHPLIVLKDMQFTVLKSLIEFMYCGETSVTEENLPSLLQAAKFFQVRGLSSMTKEALGITSTDSPRNGGDAGSTPIPGRPLKPKHVSIQSVKTSGDKKKNIFRSAAKTIPKIPSGTTDGVRAETSHGDNSQADNAQLLLSLSGISSLPQQAVKGPNIMKKTPKSYRMKQQPTTPRVAKKKPKKESSFPIMYQDPMTNIVYQVGGPIGEAGEAMADQNEALQQAEQPIANEAAPTEAIAGEEDQGEALAEQEGDNIIYQLEDGTITDQFGNPILDEAGNTQNIQSFQTSEEAAPAAEEGTDMPILLDDGQGNYLTEDGETITGDPYVEPNGADSEKTSFEPGENGESVANMEEGNGEGEVMYVEEGQEHAEEEGQIVYAQDENGTTVMYTQTENGEYVVYKEKEDEEMSVEQALEEMMGGETDGATSSLLKNALQQSGIAENNTELKGATRYQITNVDGQQQIRLVESTETPVIGEKRKAWPAGENDVAPRKRMMLLEDD